MLGAGIWKVAEMLFWGARRGSQSHTTIGSIYGILNFI